MWIMSATGFVSAVQDREDASIFRVRARDKISLENMLQSIKAEGHDVSGLEIVTGKGTDYRWRVLMPRDLFGVYLLRSAGEVNYPNFKSAVTKTRGKKFHDALMDVWIAMLAVDDGTEKKKTWDLSGRNRK